MLVRFFLIIFTPPFMVAVFFSTLWREVKGAPWFAWNECCIQLDIIRRAWRAKSFNIEE